MAAIRDKMAARSGRLGPLGALRALGLVMGIALLVLFVEAFSPAGDEARGADAATPSGESASATEPSDPQALAEPPYWPIGSLVPEEIYEATRNKKKNRKRKTGKAEVLIWIPEDLAVVKSILFIAPNTDSKHVGEHDAVRAVARKHGMAVVYPRIALHWILAEGKGGVTEDFLAFCGRLSGHPELAHVPWVVFGKSSMGRHPIYHAWAFPERTIACITYHGETPTWPLPEWATAKEPEKETIPYLSINGHHEWMGTWYRHVRPMHLNYRALSHWLPHPVVLRNVGHGNYADKHGTDAFGKPVAPGVISCLRVWDYIALYLDKVLALRVPAEADPRAGAVELRDIPPASGIYLHPRAVEAVAGYKARPIRIDGKEVQTPYTPGAGELYTIIDHVKEAHEVYAPATTAAAKAVLFLQGTDASAEARRARLWIADQELLDAWMAIHEPHPEDPVREPKAEGK